MVPDIELQKRKQASASSLSGSGVGGGDTNNSSSSTTSSSSNSSVPNHNNNHHHGHHSHHSHRRNISSSLTPSPDSRSSSSSSRSRSPSCSNGSRSHNYSNQDRNHNNNNNYHNGNYHNNRHNGNHQPPRPSSSSSYDNPQLPIHLVKEQLITQLDKHDSVIVIGETGCGKTTQIPKFIYEFYNRSNPNYWQNSNHHGIIGITQPRRVAAISIATRVATEMQTDLGDLVGYSIRFEDVTSASKTKIKYMTDGILLREAIFDPLLTKYHTIILDEAHERTVQTDVLFGVIKKAQRLRKLKRPLEPNDNNDGHSKVNGSKQLFQLKLIIMSATMDVDHFSKYFNDAPVYYISGRTHPIEIFYTEEKQSDYVATALSTVFQIHRQEDELKDGSIVTNGNGKQGNNNTTSSIGGDIVVFCTGQEEIESMIKIVRDLSPQLNQFKTRSGRTKTLVPLPLYAALPTSKQQQIFSRNSSQSCFRRVIFATNIAETSITIPNIRFVIDTGKVKSRIFSPKTGFEVMRVEEISKAQACQRSGRAGRIAPGQCYRLYTKREFRKMRPFSIPEIQKCNLSNIILQLIAIGVQDVVNFDFIDSPSEKNIESSIAQLTTMKAIEIVKKLSNETCQSNSNLTSSNSTTSTLYRLTDIGRQMVAFPVDPRFSALIIASKLFHCTDEIVIIIAMLSVDSVFYVPSEERELALKMHQKFNSSEGDLIRLLNVFRRFKEAKQSNSWCQENFLRPVQLKMASKIRQQLMELCQRASIPVMACSNTELVRRCLAIGLGVGVGLGANIAMLQRDGDYRTLELNLNLNHQGPAGDAPGTSVHGSTSPSKIVYIHPSSCMFSCSSKPECLLFTELIHTSKSYMRNICLVDPQWLLQQGTNHNPIGNNDDVSLNNPPNQSSSSINYSNNLNTI